MTHRRLAMIPFLWAGLLSTCLVLVPASAVPGVHLFGTEFSKALATFGCFMGAYTFERGDYMRRAWSFNGWCYLLLLTRDLGLNLFNPAALIFGFKFVAWGGALVFFANVSSCIGVWMLARAWSIAGLELPGSKLARGGLMLLAIGLALGISGSDLLVDSRQLLGGDPSVLHSVASDLGDTFGLALIAPVLLTAIAMRGGVLRWPWALLTASLLFWLTFDAVSIFEHVAPGHEGAAQIAREAFRALACGAECAAGLSQRLALREEPVSEPNP